MSRFEELKSLRTPDRISANLMTEILTHEVGQAIWDYIPDLLVLHTKIDDPEIPGQFIMCSQSWTTELGWTLEELVSKPFEVFVCDSSMEATKEIYESGKTEDKLSPLIDDLGHFVNRYKTKDGGTKTLMWNKNAVTIDGRYHLSVARIIK